MNSKHSRLRVHQSKMTWQVELYGPALWRPLTVLVPLTALRRAWYQAWYNLTCSQLYLPRCHLLHSTDISASHQLLSQTLTVSCLCPTAASSLPNHWVVKSQCPSRIMGL